jgi:hypothetical protein
MRQVIPFTMVRDNAVGTTTVLSMAKNLAKYQPNVRLYLFYLREKKKGLLGSYYVENPVLPLNQMVFCFNVITQVIMTLR